MRASRTDHSRRFSDLEDWLNWLETLHPQKIDLGLERIREVLVAMGLERPTYRIITVGGTNGKGSCVAILESIYLEAGYRVGAFTSPHLWRFNERLRVDGQDTSDDELVAIFSAIDAARGAVTLTYFEFSAVAAIAEFARQGVQLAIFEVGLGGRLDAVNALDPDASLIVSIDLDHQAWLGDTREAVALEKAGILRKARPAIVAERDPPAVLVAYAQNLGTTLRLLGRDFDYELLPDGGWRYQAAAWEPPTLPVPSFGGRVQLGNAAACVAVIHSLAVELPVSDAALASGIERAWLPARLERRLLDGIEWVFDVAHNPAAAGVLADELALRGKPRRTIAVFAAMADKDLAGIIDPLLPVVDEWLVTCADTERGASEDTLIAVLTECHAKRISAYPVVAEACRHARDLAADGDRVLVFGTCYVVGPAMMALGLYCAPYQPDDRSSTWTGA